MKLEQPSGRFATMVWRLRHTPHKKCAQCEQIKAARRECPSGQMSIYLEP